MARAPLPNGSAARMGDGCGLKFAGRAAGDDMRTLLLLLILVSTVLLAGCQIVGDIFQAGMAVGVIMVVVILAGIVFLARKLM